MDSKEKLMPIKYYKKQKTFWIIIVFIVMVLGAISFIKLNRESESISQIYERETATIYPSQYSDRNITSNAIVADPKFRSLAIFNREGLLANTISSIKNNPWVTVSGPEKGTWLWTPVMEITPKYRDSIISGAKKNGINVIYMSVDSYLDIFVMQDGAEKDAKKKAFDKVVEDFIKTASKSGIAVDAESGWRNWAEAGHSYKAFSILNYVKTYNQTHEAKFRGFQYDVEPYLLDSYQKNKARVLGNFLDLVGETVTRLNGTDLEFTVVIPEFYDGTNSETPSFSYLGNTGFAIDHLLKVLDRRAQSKIIIMSYRNFSRGNDGSIDVSLDEILKANKAKTKIIVAQETGDVPPPYITFHKTSKNYFNKQLDLINKTFSKEKSYGGVAIHYINAFIDLK